MRVSHPAKPAATTDNRERTHGVQNAYAEALFAYVDEGDIQALKRLLSGKKVDVNVCDNFGRTALHHAVGNKRPELITILVEAGADVNVVSQAGETPLQIAAKKGCVTSVKTLLAKRALVDAGGADTALYLASVRGCVQSLRALLLAGASVDVMSRMGETPLTAAVRSGNYDAVMLLLMRGADTLKGKGSVKKIAEQHGYKRILKLLELHEQKKSDLFGTDVPLFEAVYYGAVEEVEGLIESGIDVNVTNSDGRTMLCIASEKGDRAMVECLLANGANVDADMRSSQTPLYIAAARGYSDVVKVLLEYHATVDFVSKNDSTTPLSIASFNGYVNVVELLLDHHACVDTAMNDRGATPLYLASSKGHIDVVKLLLARKASVNIETKDHVMPIQIALSYEYFEVAAVLFEQYTLLEGKSHLIHTIASMTHFNRLLIVFSKNKGNLKYVKKMMDLGVFVDTADQEGKTSLYYALYNDDTELVECLLNAGANINLCMKEDVLLTLLSIHAASGNKAALKWLLVASKEAGVTLWSENTVYCTLLISASQNGQGEVVSMLLEEGANPNPPVQFGNRLSPTPLMIASEQGHLDVVRRLLKAGAEPDTVDENHILNTALIRASYKGHKEVVGALLDGGASVDFYNDRHTALFLAAQNNHIDVVEILLEAGASLDVTNKNLETVVHIVSKAGHAAVLELLLPSLIGVDFENSREARLGALNAQKQRVNVLDQDGNQPLHLAVEMNHVDVARMLLERGAKNSNNEALLLIAARNANVDMMELLIKYGSKIDNLKATELFIENNEYFDVIGQLFSLGAFDIETDDQFGATFLHTAAYKGRFDVMEVLIDHGVDVNIEGCCGETLLYYVVLNGDNDKAVTFLINAGASVDVICNPSINLLTFSEQNNRVEINKLAKRYNNLRESLRQLTRDQSPSLWSIYQSTKIAPKQQYEKFKALCEGHADIFLAVLRTTLDELLQDDEDKDLKSHFKEMLQYIAKIELYRLLPSKSGIEEILIEACEIINERCGLKIDVWTPVELPTFLAAVQAHDVDLIQELIESGEMVEVRGVDGVTPLFLAAQLGYAGIVSTLITEAGANVNVARDDGATPLFIASENGKVAVVETLLAEGADIHAIVHGITSLLIAAMNGYADVVTVLIASGAVVDAADQYGATPLLMAVQHNHVSVVRVLLEAGAAAGVALTNGVSPLFFAAQNGNVEIVEMLLARGVHVDAMSAEGVTPLHMAVKNGHTRIVEMLLEQGADASIQAYGQTALEIAQAKRDDDIVALLTDLDGASNNGSSGGSALITLGILSSSQSEGSNINPYTAGN